jgi:hypothetical protein
MSEGGRYGEKTEGWRVEGVANLNPLISQYFAGLFTTEIEEPDPELLNKVNPKVNEGMNEQLLRPFSAEDVKKGAIFYWGYESTWI